MFQNILNSVFSDETEQFRSPSEPDPGDTVSIRIRINKGIAKRVMLLITKPEMALLMHRIDTDVFFDLYQAEIVCLDNKVCYSFIIETEECNIAYEKTGARVLAKDERPDEKYSFSFTPGFHVPAWAKGAVEYQIMTDRFRNGNLSNDVVDNEYYYVLGHSRHKFWDAPVDETDIRNFYGGDLQGVLEKLDYLQELGVEVIYFNPLFISPSSHKYDVQDYDHIDPHFAIIEDDVDHQMMNWEQHNGYAPRYIKRVTSVFNIYASDAFFARFCEELHRRGMKIILDGVFNHCGSFNKWMDKEGIYLGKPGYETGAFQDTESPYRKFFSFSERGSGRYADYEGWWGYSTLPKLNYEGSPELCERILAIAEKWASPPYSIDGWRLDVAADLGHSDEFNHSFWKRFRKRVKKANPDIFILAEHYGDAADWLQGDEWDSVMNYDAFMEPLTFFLTGMEKHSDSFNAELYQNGQEFFNSMLRKMARMQIPSLYSAMNELSNHDHSRFLTRTNRTVGRLGTQNPEAAGQGISKAVFREAVVVQMTWPGSPTIYYGDEAGVVGWTDPDCRRTYPWGHEDTDLIEMHKALTKMRKENPVFAEGSIKPLFAETGIICYSRFRNEVYAIVSCNNLEEKRIISVPVRDIGISDGSCFNRIFRTDRNGFSEQKEKTDAVKNGTLKIELEPQSAVIMIL